MRDMDQRLLGRAMAAVRQSLPSSSWDRHADAIVADRRSRERHLRKPDEDVNRCLFGEMDNFRSNAVLKLPSGLTPDQALALRTTLEALPVHPGPHTLSGPALQRPLADVREETQLAGYTPDQLLRIPGLVDLFNRPDVVDFVEEYLGCVPTLYSINAWWSFPASKPALAFVQYFHRDTDDWRFCSVFTYLTDVDAAGGPHQIISGSQTLTGMQHLVDRARAEGRDSSDFDAADSFVTSLGERFSQRCERLFSDSITTVTGPAGTMFLANTLALHRGLLPRSPRLMIWARYGLGPNSNSADLEQGPLSRSQIVTSLADTPRNRYVNRLMFEFDRGPYWDESF
jgi:hypothetical protein